MACPWVFRDVSERQTQDPSVKWVQPPGGCNSTENSQQILSSFFWKVSGGVGGMHSSPRSIPSTSLRHIHPGRE